MHKYDHSKQLAAAVTLCALTALGGQAAQAQATMVTMPSQLTNTTQTNPYPAGNALNTPGFVGSPFSVAVVNNNTIINNVTFTSSKNVSGVGFESAVADANDGPQFTAGDEIENTFVSITNSDGSVTNQITGPVTISFQTGVAGFGLFAQDANADTEQFMLTVFNGTTSLGNFTFAPQDNTSARGNAVFVGAQSGVGPLITSAVLSSSSFATGGGGNPTNGSNDFFFGPTQVQAPVPEASTMVGFGMGVLLFAGLALGAHRRKVNGAS